MGEKETRDLQEIRVLRNDFLRLRNSGEIEKLGKQCANCKTCENIEYHHIVPLKLGGTNNISNIVPLCHACHEAAHQGRYMLNYRDNPKAGGRPNKVVLTEETEMIFWRFYKQEIGAKELFSLLGLKNKVTRSVKEIPAYIEFLRKHNLEHRKNLVDYHESLLFRGRG